MLGCAGALRWTVDHDRLPYPTTAAFHHTSMIPRFGLVVGVLSLQAAAAAAPPSRPEPGSTSQQSAPTVRVAVDVIPIDVQVLDRQGKPITGLEASKFTVSINGRRHRVLSADLIQTLATANATTPPAVDAGTSRAAASRVSRRVIVVAIDCISFSPGTVQVAVDEARRFIARLPADDLVGLFAYPIGPDIDPTTDRASIIRALERVVGQRDVGMVSQFRLRPSEIVDIASEMPSEDGPILTALARRECGEPVALACMRRLSVEATSAALYYEAQAHVSIGALRSLFQKMTALPGRKTLVLLSAGVTASDRPGGRPDIKDLGSNAGREAARANTAIYTVHIDTAFADKNAAERGAVDSDLTDIGRDGRLRALWLEQFSGAAGGALFTVTGSNLEPAFTRVLVETSSYYLLGVEAGRADRNGLAQELKVKVDHPNATVRSRRWVAVSSKDAAPATTADLAASPPPMASPSSAVIPRPRVPLPRDVQVLADLFERGDVTRLHAQLDEARDLANVIREFRMADPPWPERPRLAAVFALELAVGGLRSDNGFARDQAARLLAEYNTRVRQPLEADTFECAWLWAEAAALGGLLRPSLAGAFVSRAVARCPGEPRLHLAAAIIAEQEWLSVRQPGSVDAAEVMERYAAAMTFTETALEARVRAAFVLLRTSQPAEALELLGDPPDSGADGYVAYLAWLIRSRVLRALGRPDEAMAALRRALIVWPGGQAARVALMTLLFTRGDREHAAILAEEIQTAGEEQFDPWWTYLFGDFRAYPAIIARLRDLAD